MTGIKAALTAYQKLSPALQQDYNVAYSYQCLRRYKGSNLSQQTQLSDALLKAIHTAKTTRALTNAQQQAQKLCQDYAAADYLTANPNLKRQYTSLCTHFATEPLVPLTQRIATFKTAFTAAMATAQNQLFDQAFAVLLRYAHSPAANRRQPACYQAYQNLKQSLRQQDYPVVRQATIVLNNVLTISNHPFPRVSLAIKAATKPITPPVATPINGTPGLTLTPISAPAGPLYFM
ncbi:hypothetical protein ACFQ5M_03105 [Agrilactobacillus yilanensis]|uniref:Uncharacterized protein n=1 Tax=Agrilactobacillus yilanensis TaxID=2485997 RepID=A0ABW4J3W7_9LACO|nr:hypothetical protein [Agrilactobacillus yilanensis]